MKKTNRSVKNIWKMILPSITMIFGLTVVLSITLDIHINIYIDAARIIALILLGTLPFVMILLINKQLKNKKTSKSTSTHHTIGFKLGNTITKRRRISNIKLSLHRTKKK